jgi:hypothetical protein
MPPVRAARGSTRPLRRVPGRTRFAAGPGGVSDKPRSRFPRRAKAWPTQYRLVVITGAAGNPSTPLHRRRPCCRGWPREFFECGIVALQTRDDDQVARISSSATLNSPRTKCLELAALALAVSGSELMKCDPHNGQPQHRSAHAADQQALAQRAFGPVSILTIGWKPNR